MRRIFILYDFTTLPKRLGTGSVKWDDSPKEGQLPMWVADMDFLAPPFILDAIQKRANEQVFGYTFLKDDYYKAVIDWMKRRHQLDIEADWIIFTPGVVLALTMAIQVVSKPLDGIMLCTPVYGPFLSSIELMGRIPIKCPLKNDNGYYTFDFDKMEAMITPTTKAIMLCSPHNPVGRVWKREELVKLADFCKKHDIFVIADEIHSDLVYTPHTSFYSISEDAAQRSILCTAPSKTFNLAGLQASNIIIKNKETHNRFVELLGNFHIGSPNVFVESIVNAVYTQGDDWVEELLMVLKDNCEYFCNAMNQIPGLHALQPEGTYLVWLDCSGLNKSQEEINTLFFDTCNIFFNDGLIFGDEGEYFQRVNLACPKSVVIEAVKRIQNNLL